MTLFPVSTCLLCGSGLRLPAPESEALCALCRALVYPGLPPPAEGCAVCHQALLGERGVCVDCSVHAWAFSAVHGLFAYQSRSGELVRAYKGRATVALAHHWARQLAPLVTSPGVLVPVPAHRGHTRQRGWDPVGTLCRELRRVTRLPLCPALVRRATASQKLLGRAERAANAAASYGARASVTRLVGRDVWLVDDVVTTGWTVQACAQLLRQAGAREVRVLCLCLH